MKSKNNACLKHSPSTLVVGNSPDLLGQPTKAKGHLGKESVSINNVSIIKENWRLRVSA